MVQNQQTTGREKRIRSQPSDDQTQVPPCKIQPISTKQRVRIFQTESQRNGQRVQRSSHVRNRP